MKTTIVIPVYNEGGNIRSTLSAIRRDVRSEYAVAIVYDRDDDTTLPEAAAWEKENGVRVRRIRNKYGRGALNAIRTGMEEADSEYVIVTMADLSDPPSVMNDMIEKADREQADIVCASRYMPGGRQIGGPFLKGLLSRCAGLSLRSLADLPTHDPTNSFKLYRKSFLTKMTIESTGGFELGLELVVKAWKQGYKVTEVPTEWHDRVDGKSNFKLWKWLPHYLHWYFDALRHGLCCQCRNNYPVLLAWLVVLIAAFINFSQVDRLALDVPVEDEWDYLYAVENFSWETLFSVHVQHRIVPTRLEFYLSWLADGLNIRNLILVNWFFYVGFVLSVILLFRRNSKEFPFFPLFFLPFFSDLPHVNLLWAGQGQFHFMLLFGMLAVYFGFSARKCFRNDLLFVLFLIFSTFSMSPSLPAVLLGLWGFRRLLSLRDMPAAERPAWIRSTVGFGVTAAAGIGLFFWNYEPTPLPKPTVSWLEFLNQLRRGLMYCITLIPQKIKEPAGWWMLLPFLLPLVLFLVTLWRRRRDIIRENGPAFAILVWTVFFCMVIMYARYGVLGERHVEVILPAVPAFASVLVMIRSAKWRKTALYCYLIGILISLSFAFSFRQAEEKCFVRFCGGRFLLKNRWRYNQKIEFLYPNPFPEQRKRAERLNITFFRNQPDTFPLPEGVVPPRENRK